MFHRFTRRKFVGMAAAESNMGKRNRHGSRRFVLAFAVLTGILGLCRPVDAQIPARAHVWSRWETALRSGLRYENPCRDVTIRVTFTGPGGQVRQAYGFWDGGDTFRVRCAFPAPGEWRWHSECSEVSDTGLHRQSGTVHVTPYQGNNPLYRHGFPQVSENRRYLCFADGTPLLWIGDTAWAGPMKATVPDWDAYLTDRATKRFTVIQVGPASDWAGKTFVDGVTPFIGEGITRPNPAFWQAYERKIQRANEEGMYVMMVGLMEPVSRYPSSEEACLFARHIVARLYGNFVAFSPSFDSEYMELGDDVGKVTREATAAHLITQHPGTPSGKPTNIFAEAYFDRSYLDFAGNQSGHNRGNRERCASQAIEWNLHLYRREPHKPVINLEAFYDHDQKKPNGGTAADARSLGWRSWLSGAMGYTYGTSLLRWETDPANENYWRKCAALPSSDQMTAMHDFLAALEWWRLEPAHELIRNQPAQASKRMVLARAARGDFAVAYLPDNPSIELDLSGFPSPLVARWFDPINNRYHDIPNATESKGKFTPPRPGDWVLLLKASTGP